MLAGTVLSSIVVGAISFGLSILSGHSPVIALALYSVSGCCGILALAWRATLAERRLQQG